MWILEISFKLFILVLLTIIRTQADSSACEIKEKNLAALDLAKESISKAKDLQPDCVNDSKDISSNSSECGAKEKVGAYLDIAMKLIDDAKENYSTCDEVRNITREVLDKKPADCSEIMENGENKSGIYTIWPRNRLFDGLQLSVFCDMDTDGGGWTVIQRRGNFSQKIDFYRNWTDYKEGFGNISEEFWIGNDKIFALTNQKDYSVRFDLQNVDKEYRFATYSSFWIADETDGYRLHFDKYNGTAGDGIEAIKGTQFSTKDKKYEKMRTDCITEKMSGWWFNSCGHSNPNGLNVPGVKALPGEWKYMNWYPWTEYNPLLTIEIKIRNLNI